MRYIGFIEIKNRMHIHNFFCLQRKYIILHNFKVNQTHRMTWIGVEEKKRLLLEVSRVWYAECR